MSTTEVPDAVITDRIAKTETIIYSDLSPVIDETTLGTAGSSSKTINLLAIYKAVELTLVYYHGAARQAEEVSDVQYWRKLYEELRDKILAGEIKIVSGSEDYSPISYPKINGSTERLKLYPRKGIPGFTNDGADEDYRDDNN